MLQSASRLLRPATEAAPCIAADASKSPRIVQRLNSNSDAWSHPFTMPRQNRQREKVGRRETDLDWITHETVMMQPLTHDSVITFSLANSNVSPSECTAELPSFLLQFPPLLP